MNIGIICEYNPFHYGHLLHLKEVKKKFPDSNIILVLSGPICQRGDLSIYSKWDKTKIALNYGVDIVIELPIKYIQSADIFALGALKILNEFKCDYIVFGSESNDINKLYDVANTQLNNKEYDNLVKKYCKEGFNYPTSLGKALNEINGTTVNTPNDLLGLSYIKQIIINNYNIKPICIKRNNDYNSKKVEGKITSATSIRECIKKNKRYKKYLPKESYKYIKNPIFLDDYFNLIKYKIISDKLSIYQGLDETLENRMKNYINESNSFEEFINNIKTKRYTYNRIKRSIINILFGIEKENFKDLELNYMRILGINEKGKKVLNKLKKDINVPIINTFDPKFLSLDLKICNILSLNKKIKDKKEYIEQEYKNKVIIKK